MDRGRSSGYLDEPRAERQRHFPDPGKVAQLGLGLDGKTHAGVGKPAIPKVQHWTGRDEQERPVTVLKLDRSEESALASGDGVAYSQARAAARRGSWRRAPSARTGRASPTLSAADRLRHRRRELDGDENSGMLDDPADTPN